MKILIASDISKYYMSGIASVVRLLGESLQKLGHEVKVLTLSDMNSSRKEGEEYYIASFHVPLYPDLRYTFIRRHEYLDELIEWNPDIIHAQSEGAAAEMARRIAKKTGAPLVMTMHSDYLRFFFRKHYDSWYAHFLIRLLLMWMYRGVDKMITPSEKAKKLLLSFRPNKDVRVIGNGIKLDRFRKNPTEKEKAETLSSLGLDENDITLITVSRLSKEKKIDKLISYFPKILERKSGVKLLIVGFGPDRKRLQELAEKEGIEKDTRFAGRIEQDELYRYYKLAKVFICASDYETQGLTYLESMACGIPSVCRDDSALNGVISDGVNGFLYTTEDEFVEKVIRLLEDKDLYEKMAENALASSLNYDNLIASAQLVDFYEEIIR